MARAVAPLMLEQGRGRVVTISMSEATMVRRGFVPYGPSGAAVEALSRVMAADLADSAGSPRRRRPGSTTSGSSPPSSSSGWPRDEHPARAPARAIRTLTPI
jgi:short-subunit dehydrogenase